MPYSSTQELPPEVKKKYTSKQQSAFRKAFNDAMKQGKSEAQAFKIAHSAAQRTGNGDKAMSLLECAHEGCARKFVDEATLHDHAESVHTLSERRSLVSKAVRSIHGQDSFLVDLSDDWLVYDQFSDGMGYLLYKQSYSLDSAGNVKLKGDPSEVVRKVSYIPAPKIETAEATLDSIGISFATDQARERRVATTTLAAQADAASLGSQTTLEMSKAKSQTPHKFAPQPSNPKVCAVCNRAKGDALHGDKDEAKEGQKSDFPKKKGTKADIFVCPKCKAEFQHDADVKLHRKNKGH